MPSPTPRDPDLTEHTFPGMVRSRVYGTLAWQEGKDDGDALGGAPLHTAWPIALLAITIGPELIGAP